MTTTQTTPKIYEVTANITERKDGLYDGYVDGAKNVFAPRDTMVAAEGNKIAEWLIYLLDTAEHWNKTPKTNVDGNPVESTIKLYFTFWDPQGVKLNNTNRGLGGR